VVAVVCTIEWTSGSRDVESTHISKVKVKTNSLQRLLAAASVCGPFSHNAFHWNCRQYEANKGNVNHRLKAFKEIGTRMGFSGRKWQVDKMLSSGKTSRCLIWYPTPLMQMHDYSKKVKRLVWTTLRARSASRSSMTQEMLISLAPKNNVSGGVIECQASIHTLRNHLDVDVVVTKHAEELARDTNHVLELLTNQAHDGHVRHNVDSAELAKIVDGTLEILVLDLVLIYAATAQHSRLRVQRHRDVDL
jgi:hypothetical protein